LIRLGDKTGQAGDEGWRAALADAMPHAVATRDGLRIDAIRLCAMASARLGRWPESLRYWNALCDEEPSAFNSLQTR
jgi:hypothetical protein